MKRDWISTIFLLVSLCSGARDKRSYRTLGLSCGAIPVQTVALTGVAQDVLSKLSCAFAIARFAGILRLSVSEVFENVDREQLVSTYSSVQQFFFAGGCIENPTAILLYEGNWNRPVLGADI